MEAELSRHAQNGSHMAVRQRALDPKRVPGYDGRLALQYPAERLHLGVRPMREIGKRARDRLGLMFAFDARLGGHVVGHPGLEQLVDGALSRSAPLEISQWPG